MPMMEEAMLPTSSTMTNPFPDNVMFVPDNNNFIPETLYTGYEDMDTLPEDWSTFFWNEPGMNHD
jgi:hypothetical protein